MIPESSNKPDAANPAMTLWLTIKDHRRRVADLDRWAKHMHAIAAAIILSSVAAIAGTNAPSAPSGGIGATVWVREHLEVARVAKRSPSDRAGLHVMDKIVEIDGKSTKGLTLSAAVSALRGPAGSRVTLKVRSVGAATAREVVLTRELLDAEKIEWKNEVVYTTKYGTSFVVEEGSSNKVTGANHGQR